MNPSRILFKKPSERRKSSIISKIYSHRNSTCSQHSNFLYVYFFFSYCILLSPFRFQNVGSGVYKLHSWMPQKILCGLSNVLVLIRLFTTLRLSLGNAKSANPVSYFVIFSESTGFIYKATMMILFWTRAKLFDKFINLLDSRFIIPYNIFHIESMLSISLFCGAYAVLGILRILLGSTYINYFNWSPEWLYRRLVAEARYTFFLTNSTDLNIAPELEEITSFDIFLAILQALSLQSRFLTGFFVDLCILMSALSLWAPVSGFTWGLYKQQLATITAFDAEKQEIGYDLERESSARMHLQVVLKQFETLKTLSVLLGEAIGYAIFPFIGEALFDYYAVYIDSILLLPDILTRVVLIFYYICASGILFFSAEIVRKMNWFRLWIGDRRRVNMIPQNQLSMILDDLEHHSVGVTASGVFTFNYSIAGSIVSVLITYFIIRLQSETRIHGPNTEVMLPQLG